MCTHMYVYLSPAHTYEHRALKCVDSHVCLWHGCVKPRRDPEKEILNFGPEWPR